MKKLSKVQSTTQGLCANENNLTHSLLVEESKECIAMSEVEAINLTSLTREVIDNIPPKPSRAVPHDHILDNASWKQINDSVISKKISLSRIYNSLSETYLYKNLTFFKNFAQFYSKYRQACKILGLPLVERKKKQASKSE